ncbi:MAG: ABC transporter ATP-binding protein [Acidobacteriota bacterium]
MERIIYVENIFKIYKMGEVQIPALRGLTLEVENEEFISIMGPSGSGKSTLLNIISCMDVPTAGKYFLEDQDVSKMRRNELAKIRNKKVGLVFQNFNLLSRTSAIENVELPLLYNNTSAKERRKRAYEALESVGLKGREKHTNAQLSGGEQQRVAIARAIVNDPRIILADEPTGNLDSVSSLEIMNIFQKLNEEGRTIIIITHERDIASFSKRMVSLRDGKIIGDVLNSNEKNAESELMQVKKNLMDKDNGGDYEHL